MGKFDERSDEAVFLRYALDSMAYRVYNKHTMCVEKRVHIIFDEIDILCSVQEQDDFHIGLTKLPNIDEESSPFKNFHLATENQAREQLVNIEVLVPEVDVRGEETLRNQKELRNLS